MNLTSLALRLATAGALRDATWAGTRVNVQPIDPLAGLSDGQKPLIAIYTGETVVEGIAGRDVFGGDHTVDLIIQTYVPPRLVLAGVGTVDTSNEYGEAVIEIMGRQIEVALMQAETAWAKLWRDLIFEVVGINSKPYLIQSDKGPRAVAREVQYTLKTISSPPFGQPAGVWAALLAAVDADEANGPLHTLIAAALRGNALPAWKDAIYSLGLRRETGEALGIGPVAATDAGEIPPLTDGGDIIFQAAP